MTGSNRKRIYILFLQGPLLHVYNSSDQGALKYWADCYLCLVTIVISVFHMEKKTTCVR